MNSFPGSAKVSGFTQKHRSAKLLVTWITWQLTDVLAQAQAFECRNGTRTLLLFHLFMLFTAKKEFILIKLVQGLKLNRRSIAGLEIEKPIPLLGYCDRASWNVGWIEINQQDATNPMFIIKLLSQHVSGIIMPIIRRTRPCITAYGVLHWLCWLWLCGAGS